MGSEPRRRPVTDTYLDAVQRAADAPGRWIDIPRTFKSESNASITGYCLREGYLRVEPRPGEPSVRVAGKSYLALRTPVEAEHRETADGWVLRIRTSPE